MPEPDGGNFCGTGRWLNRVFWIILLIALVLVAWKFWILAPQMEKIAQAANDLPQVIENLKGHQEISTSVQVVVNIACCNLSGCYADPGANLTGCSAGYTLP